MPRFQVFGQRRPRHGGQRQQTAAGAYGGQDGVRVGGEQHNQGLRRRFLEGFEQGVGRLALAGGHCFRAVKDDDLAAAFDGGHRKVVFGFPHLFNADAGGSAGVAAHGDDVQVGVYAAPDTPAGFALPAGAGGGRRQVGEHSARLQPVDDGAVDGGGQVQRQGHFADVRRPGQQVRVGQAPGLQAGVQTPHQ